MGKLYVSHLCYHVSISTILEKQFNQVLSPTIADTPEGMLATLTYRTRHQIMSIQIILYTCLYHAVTPTSL